MANIAAVETRESADGGIVRVLRRLFLGSSLALLALGITVLSLYLAWRNSAGWARHSRELTRVARDARASAREHEVVMLGFLLGGDDAARARLTTHADTLGALLDSLVQLSADNPYQRARARSTVDAAATWQREQIAPLLAASPAERATMIASGRAPSRAPFDSLTLALNRFLAEEERLFRSRAGRTRELALSTLAAMVAEIILLALLLRRLRGSVLTQARDLEDHRAALVKHAALLERRTTELRHQAVQLQEQAVELELQTSEAQMTADELEAKNQQLEEALAATAHAEGIAEARARERDALRAQLEHSQRMESIGRLAGAIAHDFNNVLTVIKGYAGLVLGELPADSPMRADVEEVSHAADRAGALTRQLLSFSRRQVPRPRPLLLDEVAGEMESMLRRIVGTDIELRTRFAADLRPVIADPGQIEQIIMNLVVNARDAMPHGGRLEIATANVVLSSAFAGRRLSAPGGYVVLSVSDTGAGIPPELRERIFEPFFTTKEEGKGTGLGLSTVYGIVKQAGGDVWVQSEPGRGTRFEIYLPVLEDDQRAEAMSRAARPAIAGGETILLVEDDAALSALTSRLLRRYGYEVLTAGDGLEAIEIARRSSQRIDLVISDVVMPNLGGRLLARRLRGLRPELPVLLMSGFSEEDARRRDSNGEEFPYLQKPFVPGDLVGRIAELL